MSDLLAVRELCVQIERTKESLSRQLASQSVSHDQSQEDMAGLIAERDLLKQQVLYIGNYYGYHFGNDLNINTLSSLFSHLVLKTN